MGKYQPIEDALRSSGTAETPMSFAEIERVLGFPLPPASRDHRAWWSNNPSNNVMTKSWLAAGYRSERVDMAGEKLVFRRLSTGDPSPAAIERTRGNDEPRSHASSGKPQEHASIAEGPAPSFVANRPTKPGLAERLWRRLGGTVKIAEGYDLTQPTGEVWDAEQ